jgi:cyclooctatin synthase
MFTFLNGGTDTSSSTLIWMSVLLAQHPHVMRKVREEVRSVLGDQPDSLAYEDLSQLVYCNHVVKETWRLFPPSIAAARVVLEDIVLKDMVIPKGWEVWASIYALHRDPEIYENPDTFHPGEVYFLCVCVYVCVCVCVCV